MKEKSINDLRKLQNSIYELSVVLDEIADTLENADDTTKNIIRSGDYYPFECPISEVRDGVLDWCADTCTKIETALKADEILSKLSDECPLTIADILQVAIGKANDYEPSEDWNPIDYLDDTHFSPGRNNKYDSEVLEN